MIQTVGFIGCGKMGQAMIGGLIQSGTLKASQIIASAQSEETLEKVKRAYEVETTFRNQTVAEAADCLVLAVHPYEYESVIKDIRSVVSPEAIVLTIAAGKTMNQVEDYFGRPIKLVRTMPNTPSFVGEGMTAMCVNANVADEEKKDVKNLLSSFGAVEVLSSESQMDAIPAVSGSSPAYVYVMIEAMADGAVRQGLSREQAYRLAAQSVLGAAKMVLESGQHPGVLKDQVCSPGGSTIAAIATLEEKRFRGAILAAMESCTNRNKELKDS